MRVLNKKYWPYQVNLPVSVTDDQLNWLSDTMPNTDARRWKVTFFNHGYETVTYHFANEKDAILFSLRWA